MTIEESLISGGLEMSEAIISMIIAVSGMVAFFLVFLYVLRFIIRFLRS